MIKHYGGLLLVIYVQSKWLEAFIVRNTIEHTINCVSPLFYKHGYPISLVSDKAPQFTSVEFKTLLGNHEVKHIISLPYHPDTNGHSERYLQILTDGL